MTPVSSGKPTDIAQHAVVTLADDPSTPSAIDQIRLFDTLEAAETVWRELETVSATSAHLSYDWCRTWVDHARVRPLVVLIDFADGARMLLPLEVTRIGGARVGRFIGSRFSNINFGLFTPGLDTLCPTTMAKALRDAGAPIDLLALYRTPKTWRGIDNPLMALARVKNQNDAFQLDLEGGFDKALSRINGKKRRKKYRLGLRRMEERGGYRLVHGDDPETAIRLLDAFFDQKAARFERQGKLDVFARPEVKAFFRALATTPSPQGGPILRLSTIETADGHFGSVAGVTRWNGHMICQFGSIEETVAADFSIGEFLFYHLIEEGCREGYALYDFGIGDEAYKRSWCDRITTQYDCYLPLSMKGSIVGTALRATTAAKRRIKSDPRLDSLARVFQRRMLSI